MQVKARRRILRVAGQHLAKRIRRARKVAQGRIPDAEVPLFARIVRAAVAQQDTIDRMLSEALPADWPLARIDPVLRAVMRAGTAELAMAGGAPAKVVINEYLDVARGFFIGAEPGMANAVLDRLARLLRPGEFRS